ncbi:MAG: AMP-binding protein [bacterium]|nr:AMP-binding protein [bacterium]
MSSDLLHDPPRDFFLKRFAAVVARFPREIAVIDHEHGGISYANLQRRARALAKRLRHRAGLRARELVALDLPAGREMITAMLAVWHGDAAFLMLDRSHPPARRAAILNEAEPRLILQLDDHGRFQIKRTDSSGANKFTNIPAATGPVRKVSPKALPNTPGDASAQTAYLVFTSGTSGRPRGVAVSHAGITAFLDAQIRAFALESGNRMLATLSPAFDAALSEYGTTLLAGATLVFAPEPMRKSPAAFGRLLRDKHITHVCLPPSILTHWPVRDMPETLRTVIIGGEAAPAGGVRDWAGRFRLINVYGPSEATVCTSLWRCDSGYSLPYLGETIPGMQWRAVNPESADGAELPVGEAGELWLAGPGLALGYWRDTELTSTRFVERDGRRWYRTGDRVRRHSPAGPQQFEFLGRMDRQIQVHGNRVEALELERHLAACPGALEALVRLSPEDGEIEACVVFAGQAPPLTAEELRATVRTRLPEYFVPRHIRIRTNALPRNANGKIDEAAAFRSESEAESPASVQKESDARRQTETETETESESGGADAHADEELLIALWTAIFGESPASIYANFFQAGGTSFLLLRFLAGASANGIHIEPASFYADPTIHGALAKSNRDAQHSTTQLRADARLSDAILKRIRLNRRPVPAAKKIFMTGATGLLGASIVEEILNHSDFRILCLARDPDAARRSLSERQQRLRIISGDLTRPRLGLSPTDYDEIIESCDTLLHCGARVHLTESYEQLRAANLEAAREILELATRGPAKRLHFVSTLSVAVASDWTAGVFFEDDPLEAGREIYGGYARSKWAAEVLFQNALAAGLRHLTIHRPGWLLPESAYSEIDGAGSGDAHFRTSREDFLKGLIDALRTLDFAPEAGSVADRLRMDCTPVRYAARAIASLIVDPVSDETASNVYHLANDEALGWPRFIAAVAPRERIPIAQFLERLSRLSRSADPERAAAAGIVEAALGWRLRREARGEALQDEAAHSIPENDALRGCDLFAATHRRFDRTHTRRVLEGRGIVCPSGAQAFADYLTAINRSVRETIQKRRP